MKISAILATVAALAVASASAQAPGCQKVSVVGDATYCISGPLCSGSVARKGGDRCPQAGDVAVEACRPNLPSYNKATGKCTAPTWANCQVLPTGAWGCVWNRPGAPAPTPAVTSSTPAPTPARTTTAPVTQAPAPTPARTSPAPTTAAPTTTTPAPTPARTSIAPTTTAPVVTTPAPTTARPSPAPTTTTPVATTPAPTTPAPTPAKTSPTSATTTPAPTPARTTTAPVTTTPAPTPARTTTAPTPAPTTQTPAPTPAKAVNVTAAQIPGFQKVSVVGDATYYIKGPICSGTAARKGGDRCPQAGDVAVEACRPGVPSFDKATGKCTAPVWANCQLIPTGAWGCVWDRSKVPAQANSAKKALRV